MNELLPVSVKTEHNIFKFYNSFIIWIFFCHAYVLVSYLKLSYYYDYGFVGYLLSHFFLFNFLNIDIWQLSS